MLDEIHTYAGKRGADVACLVRRLKERTGTIGKLCCIGTSATMHSDVPGEDERESVARFARQLAILHKLYYGKDLYAYESTRGGSIKKMVDGYVALGYPRERTGVGLGSYRVEIKN